MCEYVGGGGGRGSIQTFPTPTYGIQRIHFFHHVYEGGYNLFVNSN